MTEKQDQSKGVFGEFLDFLYKMGDSNPAFHRISSMFLDHIIISAITVPPFIALMLITREIESYKTNLVETVAFYFVFLVYLNKDFVQGKSIAKRLMGLQIVNRRNGLPANEIQCLIRNLTVPIWPLEVVVSLFSPHRRIGDVIANTN